MMSRLEILCRSSNSCNCSCPKWKLISCQTVTVDLGDSENQWEKVAQAVIRCNVCGGLCQERLLGEFTYEDLELRQCVSQV